MLIKPILYDKDIKNHNKVVGLYGFDPYAINGLFQLLQVLTVDEVTLLLNYYYQGKIRLKHKVLLDNLTMWKIPFGYTAQIDFLLSFNKKELDVLLKMVRLSKTINSIENTEFSVNNVVIPMDTAMGEVYQRLCDRYYTEEWFQPTTSKIEDIIDTTKVVARTKFKIGLNILCYFKKIEQIDNISYCILRK